MLNCAWPARVSIVQGQTTCRCAKRKKVEKTKDKMLNAYGQAPKDIEIASPPPDGISAIGWSPTADLLAGACWDNQVRIWEVSASGISTPKAVITHEQPALCLDWSSVR